MSDNLVIDLEFVKFLSTLGIGGILAALMFVFYRKDVRQYTELWKLSTESLMIIVKENTASNTKLISLIENLERNSIRKTDISDLIDEKLRSRREVDVK